MAPLSEMVAILSYFLPEYYFRQKANKSLSAFTEKLREKTIPKSREPTLPIPKTIHFVKKTNGWTVLQQILTPVMNGKPALRI